MQDRTKVYKVVRNENGVLKSAVIGARGNNVNHTKFQRFELVYPIGITVKRRCLAFRDFTNAREWMHAMKRIGFEGLELWAADTLRAVRLSFILRLEDATVTDMEVACSCSGFFDRVRGAASTDLNS